MKILYLLLLAAGPAYGQSFLPVTRDSLHPGPLLPEGSPFTVLPKQPLLPSLSFPHSLPRASASGFFQSVPRYQDFLLPGQPGPEASRQKMIYREDADPIRISRSDNMPCLIPNPANLERMPVRRLPNGSPIDHMPNGTIQKKP